VCTTLHVVVLDGLHDGDLAAASSKAEVVLPALQGPGVVFGTSSNKSEWWLEAIAHGRLRLLLRVDTSLVAMGV
jgi:hypothetical protein